MNDAQLVNQIMNNALDHSDQKCSQITGNNIVEVYKLFNPFVLCDGKYLPNFRNTCEFVEYCIELMLDSNESSIKDFFNLIDEINNTLEYMLTNAQYFSENQLYYFMEIRLQAKRNAKYKVNQHKKLDRKFKHCEFAEEEYISGKRNIWLPSIEKLKYITTELNKKISDKIIKLLN